MVVFEKALAQEVAAVLKKLLSEKHLYQSVDVDMAFVDRLAKEQLHKFVSMGPGASSRAHPSFAQIKQEIMQGVAQAWIPHEPVTRSRGAPPVPMVQGANLEAAFWLPTINAFCHRCKESWPCNPAYGELACFTEKSDSGNQCFYLGYECQNCKAATIRFLVRRAGIRLRLCGRDPFETVVAPKVLPKSVSAFYTNALIAHHAGQTLAGVFLLRVFIEQFWRAIPEVQAVLGQDSRATGEAMGAAYSAKLPPEFKSRFPSLLDVYATLSDAMHRAAATAEMFDDASANIVEHLDALRLFKLFAVERNAKPEETGERS